MLLGRLPCSSSPVPAACETAEAVQRKKRLPKWGNRTSKARQHVFWEVSASRRDHPEHTLDLKYISCNINNGE